MDFVVVGLGVGALAVLLGLTIRDGGDRRRWRRQEPPGAPADIERRLAFGRACRAGGLVLSVAGAGILLITVAAVLLGLSDRAGAILVMAAVTATVLGGVAWALLYAHRYHPRPRSRPASRRRESDATAPEEAPPSLAGTIDAGVARLGATAADGNPAITHGEPAEEAAPASPGPAPRPEPAPATAASTEPEPTETATDAAAPAVAGEPAAPVTPPPETAAPDPDPALADEPADDADPTRHTAAVATGSDRRR